MTMITSNGKQPKEMTLAELQEEKRCQKYFARLIGKMAAREEWYYKSKCEELERDDPKGKLLERRMNGELTKKEYEYKKKMLNRTYKATEGKRVNAEFLRILEQATRLFIEEIEDAMKYHKTRPKKYKYVTKYSPYKADTWNKYRHRPTKEALRVAANKKILKQYDTLINRNGVVLQWDKRKLMLVARDRGYFSEIAVAYAIEQELEMPKYTIKRMLEEGKFTWGQVLVIGALFEMTPKEFCDTFLLGYFVENNGEWRASKDNLDINGLLAKATTAHIPTQQEKGTKTE